LLGAGDNQPQKRMQLRHEAVYTNQIWNDLLIFFSKRNYDNATNQSVARMSPYVISCGWCIFVKNVLSQIIILHYLHKSAENKAYSC
jgi:hypothetical protein